MELTSITEHSDYLHNMNLISMSERWELHRKRVEFGRQNLELWMFIPCKLVDGIWVVLEEPIKEIGLGNWARTSESKISKMCDEYQEAKDLVLFEGFELSVGKESVLGSNTTIRIHEGDTFYLNGKLVSILENLVKYNLELTETAKKQIGL